MDLLVLEKSIIVRLFVGIWNGKDAEIVDCLLLFIEKLVLISNVYLKVDLLKPLTLLLRLKF